MSATQSTQQPWDRIFKESGRVFCTPHEAMEKVVERFGETPRARVLDLGCGSGRHLKYLSHLGFDVVGIDESPRALELAQSWLDEEGLSATLIRQSIYDALPFPDQSIDAVIAVQSIHHGRLLEIGRAATEIDRVLKSHGVLFVTVPATSNQADAFEEVEPGTFIPLDGPECGLPHHFFTSEQLAGLFDGYKQENVWMDETKHLCLLARKNIQGTSSRLTALMRPTSSNCGRI